MAKGTTGEERAVLMGNYIEKFLFSAVEMGGAQEPEVITALLSNVIHFNAIGGHDREHLLEIIRGCPEHPLETSNREQLAADAITAKSMDEELGEVVVAFNQNRATRH